MLKYGRKTRRNSSSNVWGLLDCDFPLDELICLVEFGAIGFWAVEGLEEGLLDTKFVSVEFVVDGKLAMLFSRLFTTKFSLEPSVIL